jgi:hypothetical protein
MQDNALDELIANSFQMFQGFNMCIAMHGRAGSSVIAGTRTLPKDQHFQ